MSKCDVCINKKYCANHLDARTMCPQTDYVLFTPSFKTNYDLLISKTPEELANVLTDDWCEILCGSPSVCDGQCEGKMLSWLKTPLNKEGTT